MRFPLLLILLLLHQLLVAQESVPELGNNSDAGQRVFDTRVQGSASSVEGNRIHDEADVDELPTFPGGWDAFRSALWNACDAGLKDAWPKCEGANAPTIRFVVDKDGRATHVELIVDRECPAVEAALYCAMRKLPPFTPGIRTGIAVRTRLTVPLLVEEE